MENTTAQKNEDEKIARMQKIIEREFDYELLIQKRHIRQIEAEISRGELILQTLGELLRKSCRQSPHINSPLLIKQHLELDYSFRADQAHGINSQSCGREEGLFLRSHSSSSKVGRSAVGESLFTFDSSSVSSFNAVEVTPRPLQQQQQQKRRPGRPRLHAVKSRIIKLKLPNVVASSSEAIRPKLVIKLNKNSLENHHIQRQNSILNNLHDQVKSIVVESRPQINQDNRMDVDEDHQSDELSVVSSIDVQSGGSSPRITSINISGSNQDINAMDDVALFSKSTMYQNKVLLLECTARQVDEVFKLLITFTEHGCADQQQSPLMAIIQSISIRLFCDDKQKDVVYLSKQPLKVVVETAQDFTARIRIQFKSIDGKECGKPFEFIQKFKVSSVEDCDQEKLINLVHQRFVVNLSRDLHIPQSMIYQNGEQHQDLVIPSVSLLTQMSSSISNHSETMLSSDAAEDQFDVNVPVAIGSFQSRRHVDEAVYCIYCGIRFTSTAELDGQQRCFSHQNVCKMRPLNKKWKVRNKLISLSTPQLIYQTFDELQNCSQNEEYEAPSMKTLYPLLNKFLSNPLESQCSYLLDQSMPGSSQQSGGNANSGQDIWNVLSEASNVFPLQLQLSGKDSRAIVDGYNYMRPDTLTLFTSAVKMFLKKMVDDAVLLIEEEINEDLDEIAQTLDDGAADQRLITPFLIYRVLLWKKDEEYDFLLNSYMESFGGSSSSTSILQLQQQQQQSQQQQPSTGLEISSRQSLPRGSSFDNMKDLEMDHPIL
ncbi:hypothetical protein MP228_004120 [Amoeboaphelidium protococcarum]|nr:hypothetical protein MP228_004120 [Amoeboaphelidium protococcarum]